jgi:hypothetical protein
MGLRRKMSVKGKAIVIVMFEFRTVRNKASTLSDNATPQQLTPSVVFWKKVV